jgi:hypothetical protein
MEIEKFAVVKHLSWWKPHEREWGKVSELHDCLERRVSNRNTDSYKRGNMWSNDLLSISAATKIPWSERASAASSLSVFCATTNYIVSLKLSSKWSFHAEASLIIKCLLNLREITSVYEKQQHRNSDCDKQQTVSWVKWVKNSLLSVENCMV